MERDVTPLAALVLHRIRLPLLEPFVAAHGTEHERAVTLVEAVGGEGVSGWGECDALSRATYSAEDADGAFRSLRDELVPAVLRSDDVAARAAVDAPMAWTALAGALTDLHLRRVGRSLAASIGGTRTTVATTAVVGQRPTPAATVDAAAHLVDAGHRALKLKVSPGHDIGILRAVRAALPDVGLAADANGSYGHHALELDALLRAAVEVGLTYVEQPLPADDPDGLVALARRVSADVAVALDESIPTADAARQLARSGAPFALNLKPARVGGLDRALEVLAVATRAGWPVFVGGMLEAGVGRALALAAASWDACTWPTDLGPSSRYFADDVTEPIELVDGDRLPVPATPGIGVTPRPERLAALTVERVELQP
jgi:O-succinylbenzoate synthase